MAKFVEDILNSILNNSIEGRFTCCRLNVTFRVRLQGRNCSNTQSHNCRFLRPLVPEFGLLFMLEWFTIDCFHIRFSVSWCRPFSSCFVEIRTRSIGHRIFLHGHSSAYWPFPPQFQHVEFITKPESYYIEGEFHDPFSTISM